MKKEKASEAQQVAAEEVDSTVSTSSPDTTSISPKHKKKYAAGVSTSSRFGIVTLILATMGIIISVDSLIKVKEWNSGLTTFKDEVEKRLQTEQLRLNNLETALQQIGTRQKAFDKELNHYDNALTSLKPLLDKRTQQEASVDVLWQLEKAYDWLQEAQLDLKWSDDWQGALLLLQSADAVIEKTDAPALQSIHLLLVENIKALSMIQPIDEVMLLKKIKSMTKMVNNLPSSMSESATSTTGSDAAPAPKSGWRSVVNRGFEWIQHVVVIKPANSTPSSLSHFQSRRILNENLIIALQQTQWALLKKDNRLFHWSLEQVSQMLQNNETLIDFNNEQTKIFLQNLDFLKKQNLNPPTLPDIQPAYQQLKAYMDTLNGHLFNKVPA